MIVDARAEKTGIAIGATLRAITDTERMILQGSAAHYVQNAQRYRTQLQVQTR